MPANTLALIPEILHTTKAYAFISAFWLTHVLARTKPDLWEHVGVADYTLR